MEKTNQRAWQAADRQPKTRASFIQIMRGWLKTRNPFSPGHILAITLVGIALAEVAAMIVVFFLRDLPYPLQVLVDATIMTVIIFPILYYLSFKPLLQQIQQRAKSEKILQARLRLMQVANQHDLSQLMQLILNEIEALTGSEISFFHFVDAGQKTLQLQAWSSNTLENICKAQGKGSHYDLGKAGVWADAIRQRRPIIHNNYAALPNRKGMPEGHAAIARELVVPVIRDDRVVAVLGVGNKPQDYTAGDMEIVSTFTDFAWDIVQRKQADIALSESEEKFRTFVNWTYDWEKWVDPSGKIIYTSPSCERITGYRPEELIANPHLLVEMVHPEDREFYQLHQELIHDASAGHEMIEYRIIARDGSEHWIEHICRPLFGPDGQYLGRRISNREISERKLAQKKINQQSQKELILTQTVQNIQADIARDLHDMLGQNISFLSMNLEHLSAAQRSDPGYIQSQIQHMKKVANESYELIRAMLAILTLGYSGEPLRLFTRYAEQIAERAGVKIQVTSQGEPYELTPLQVRQLFYIFREGLRNIEKYAGASQVTVEFLWEKTALTLVIADNGQGFDTQNTIRQGHYGLKFMRERAELIKGNFSLQSSPGEGTVIRVVVPGEYELPTPTQ